LKGIIGSRYETRKPFAPGALKKIVPPVPPCNKVVNRDVYKHRRSAALAKWRTLAA
jgi:hypothetical protein